MSRQSPVRSFKDLRAWQEAMALAEVTYRLVAILPNSERYELSAQMRRAAVSIPSNIAEGYARESKGAYLQFLRIARGSLRELETQFLLSVRLELLDASTAEPALSQCDQVGRLLHGLIRSVDSADDNP
jgi:four helix bundle protein